MPLSNQYETQLISFTPLSGNRFRCNWNGAVIKKRQLDAARNRRWSEIYKPDSNETSHLPVEAEAPKAYRVESATINSEGDYTNCPYCKVKIWGGRMNPLLPGKMRCKFCRKEFNGILATPLPVATWTAINEGMTAYGHAACPKCQFFNTYVLQGKNHCGECGKPFVAVKA